jgi:hypothetical protein
MGNWYLLMYESPTGAPYVADAYAGLEAIEHANPNRLAECTGITPDDPRFDSQWYLHDSEPYGIDAQSGWFWETGDPLGIIAAETDNGLGVAGISWESLIMPMRIAYWDEGLGQNVVSEFDAGQAIFQSVMWGAYIINMSFGNPGYSMWWFWREAVEYAYDDCGRLPVASAGNHSYDIFYPAKFDQVICVTATTISGTRAYYAYAEGAEMELAAPGEFLTTTWAGFDYGQLWSLHPDWDNKMVRKKLQGSTIVPADGGPGWDDRYGFGIINLAKAVGPISEPVEPERGDETSGSRGGETTAEVAAVLPNGEDVLTGAFPNPAAYETTRSFSAGDGPYEVAVYDLAGRQVKSWDGAASGNVDIPWDLTEANGAAVADGLYVVRVKTASAENAIKVLVTR